jgi:hypothetical protein
MGDSINTLPIDDSVTSNSHDIDMISAIFKDEKKTASVFNGFKAPFIGAFLCLLVSSQYFDRLLTVAGVNRSVTIHVIRFFVIFICLYIINSRF